MTEVKMPEQCNTALLTNYEGASEYRNLSYDYCPISAKYSEAQMKQYGDDRAREALEMAAKVCETQDEVGPSFPNRWECASGIRALPKEIQE